MHLCIVACCLQNGTSSIINYKMFLSFLIYKIYYTLRYTLYESVRWLVSGLINPAGAGLL